MAPFVSTVTNKLDAKGRVSVPARFREILTAQGAPGVYVFPSFREEALEGASHNWMSALSAQLEGLGHFSDERDALSHGILGAADYLAFDSEGRIRIPDAMLAQAGVTDAISFVGMGDRFRLWAPDRLAARSEALIAAAKAARGALKPGGAA